MSDSASASLPASVSNPPCSTSIDDSTTTRPVWGTLSVVSMSAAACLMTGFVPAGFVPTALVGPFLLVSWCIGAVAFACSVGPDHRPVDQAIRHRSFHQAQQRAASRKAA